MKPYQSLPVEMVNRILGKDHVSFLLLHQLNHITRNPSTTLEPPGTVNVIVLGMNLPIRKYVHPV